MTTAAATRPATIRVTIPFAAAWIAAEAKAAALPASRVRHYRAFSVGAAPELAPSTPEEVAQSEGIKQAIIAEHIAATPTTVAPIAIEDRLFGTGG